MENSKLSLEDTFFPILTVSGPPPLKCQVLFERPQLQKKPCFFLSENEWFFLQKQEGKLKKNSDPIYIRPRDKSYLILQDCHLAFLKLFARNKIVLQFGNFLVFFESWRNYYILRPVLEKYEQKLPYFIKFLKNVLVI